MRDALVCMVASGALQVEAAHPVLGSVALPAVLRRPRAAPTHLRAAAIRLNVAIWTNMDPDERAQRTCHKSPWFRMI